MPNAHGSFIRTEHIGDGFWYQVTKPENTYPSTAADNDQGTPYAFNPWHPIYQASAGGLVDYRHAWQAVSGTSDVQEMAEEALGWGMLVQAVRLALCLIGEMMDLLQSVDDSDGIIGDMIAAGLEICHSVASNHRYTVRSQVTRSEFNLYHGRSPLPQPLTAHSRLISAKVTWHLTVFFPLRCRGTLR